jgi:hypothetical protein
MAVASLEYRWGLSRDAGRWALAHCGRTTFRRDDRKSHQKGRALMNVSAKALIAAGLVLVLGGCATQAEMRAQGPVASKVVSMSVAEARDCVGDHWIGGLYGKSITPYGDGYRIRNSAGQIYEFVEVQPSPEGTVISAYNTFGSGKGLSNAVMKRCAGVD